MPRFLVLRIYLNLLPDDGEGAEWIRFLYGGSIEDEGDNGVSNFLSLITRRLGFLDGDIKAETMSPPWNNFLWSLLGFVVVRSIYDERLVISFRSFFLVAEKRSLSTSSA
jgi:hypothetical protein